jgi:hypothetical protein
MSTEEILFDADRDTNGKGITPDYMIHLLKKIHNSKKGCLTKEAKEPINANR